MQRDTRAAERMLELLSARLPRVSRRTVLQAALSMAASASLLSGCAVGTSSTRRIGSYPFMLGVASGYPRPDAITLWTRLAPISFQPDGGMPSTSVDVRWEVAEDERFGKVVQSGQVVASVEHAHTVSVDVSGLAPARWYWYRFRAGGEVSPVGRTRTAEAMGAPVSRFRFAIGSCQNYEHGFYVAHRYLAQENLDLMLFLGDYIYADSWGDNPVRRHVNETARTLDEYRIRYSQYRSDPDLQRMHALVPWAVVWDDGEVENDWAADQSEHLDPEFLTRRAAALQAYFEHMPIPQSLRASGADRRVYSELAFGDLARFYLLDDRLYRSHQSCPAVERGGGGNRVYVDECADLERPDRTILGTEQERWLDTAMGASTQRWNILAQQTLVAPADSEPGPRSRVLTDMWDGYPAARARLIDSVVQRRVPNPVIVGGDIHATVAADLHRAPTDQSTPVVASAFCGTSITSQGAPAGAFDARLRANPHLKFANTHQRGYLTFELTPSACNVALRALESEKRNDSPITTAASFEVQADRPGVNLK